MPDRQHGARERAARRSPPRSRASTSARPPARKPASSGADGRERHLVRRDLRAHGRSVQPGQRDREPSRRQRYSPKSAAIARALAGLRASRTSRRRPAPQAPAAAGTGCRTRPRRPAVRVRQRRAAAARAPPPCPPLPRKAPTRHERGRHHVREVRRGAHQDPRGGLVRDLGPEPRSSAAGMRRAASSASGMPCRWPSLRASLDITRCSMLSGSSARSGSTPPSFLHGVTAAPFDGARHVLAAGPPTCGWPRCRPCGSDARPSRSFASRMRSTDASMRELR